MKIEIRFHLPKFSNASIVEFRKVCRQDVNLGYLLWAARPKFSVTRYGLYLEDRGKNRLVSYREQAKRQGRFNSEGLSNHIHLDHIVRNPVLQYLVGVSAIHFWCEMLPTHKDIKSVVIYLNETYETSRRVNYTLCVYSNPIKVDLSALESHWLRSVHVLPAKRFLKFIDRIIDRFVV